MEWVKEWVKLFRRRRPPLPTFENPRAMFLNGKVVRVQIGNYRSEWERTHMKTWIRRTAWVTREGDVPSLEFHEDCAGLSALLEKLSKEYQNRDTADRLWCKASHGDLFSGDG